MLLNLVSGYLELEVICLRLQNLMVGRLVSDYQIALKYANLGKQKWIKGILSPL
jgi:hypothetical protein